MTLFNAITGRWTRIVAIAGMGFLFAISGAGCASTTPVGSPSQDTGTTEQAGQSAADAKGEDNASTEDAMIEVSDYDYMSPDIFQPDPAIPNMTEDAIDGAELVESVPDMHTDDSGAWVPDTTRGTDIYTRDDEVIFHSTSKMSFLYLYGSLSIRVASATLYDSLGAAEEAVDLGFVKSGIESDDGPYLVCELEVHNYDGQVTRESFHTPGHGAWSFSVLSIGNPGSYANGFTDAPYPSSNSGMPSWASDAEFACFEVGVGETETFNVGFLVSKDTDPSSMTLNMMHGSLGQEYIFDLDVVRA